MIKKKLSVKFENERTFFLELSSSHFLRFFSLIFFFRDSFFFGVYCCVFCFCLFCEFYRVLVVVVALGWCWRLGFLLLLLLLMLQFMAVRNSRAKATTAVPLQQLVPNKDTTLPRGAVAAGLFSKQYTTVA